MIFKAFDILFVMFSILKCLRSTKWLNSSAGSVLMASERTWVHVRGPVTFGARTTSIKKCMS